MPVNMVLNHRSPGLIGSLKLNPGAESVHILIYDAPLTATDST